MGLVSKILDGKEPELRDYILPAVVLSTICISGAVFLVESNTPKRVYESVYELFRDITYFLMSEPLTK